ncbi:MAG: UDP-N-acetylmuramoyl-L-alanine--D-glutamate ligase [Myxococcaceae bacterium]
MLQLQGARACVIGLGRSGVAAARLLLAHGAQVFAEDTQPLSALPEAAKALAAQGVVIGAGRPLRAECFEGVSLVVVSPGVPLSLPALEAARKSGKTIWGEIELAARALEGKSRLVGITGTNGKSTTTALCGALLEAAGLKVFVGGNLGTPLSEVALSSTAPDVCVVELSSYQLEAVETLHLSAAAHLNLQPDHLDRYAHLDAYARAKARIFDRQSGPDTSVFNLDDERSKAAGFQSAGTKWGFTQGGVRPNAPQLAGAAWCTPGGVALGAKGQVPQVFRVQNRALRGRHNVQNAMAALLLAHHLGADANALQLGLDAFRGLPHRLEWIRTVGGVEWINDSKATNVDSAVAALEAFSGRPLWLIAGGKGKGAPYSPLVKAAAGQVRGVLTVGEDASAVASAFDGVCQVFVCGTLDRAVAQAQSLAVSGDVVLLSPACASLDQFRNYEHRGEAFRQCVEAL